MMRIRLAVPDAAVHPDVLDSALEAVTRTNEHLLAAGEIPDADTLIAAGAKWRPEPPGDEHFDHGGLIARRGHGDCDDWAPLKAASLRASGEDPDARAIVKRTGRNRFHAVVQRSDGSIDDPSADAGMYEYRPPLQPRLVGPSSRPVIATKQVGGVWCARCDVPWKGENVAWSGHGMARRRDMAAHQAISGGMLPGRSTGTIETEHQVKLEALQALLRGVPPAAVRAAMVAHGKISPAVVGSLFGSLLKTAVSLAPIPGAGVISNLIPDGGGGGGGGAPAAAAPAGHVAPPGAPMGPPIGPAGGSSPGGRTRAYGGNARMGPTGPIIVRF